MAALRFSGDTMTTNDYTTKLMNKPEIKALPVAVQKRLEKFMDSIPTIKWYLPDGKPKKAWRLFYGDTWASAWDSAWACARDSARDSASDSARDSASDSARDSARDSASNSARDSASDSAWDSAMDFSLMARMIVVSDLDYPDKKKHEKHVRERINVWCKGYGLLCDVDGVLYVYAKK